MQKETNGDRLKVYHKKCRKKDISKFDKKYDTLLTCPHLFLFYLSANKVVVTVEPSVEANILMSFPESFLNFKS